MRAFLISLFLVVASVLAGCTAQATEMAGSSEREVVFPVKTAKKPLLVELFTSEGCSSCPPAEALLARYESEQPFADVELITLAFHVDYWDDLGWKDPYASALFTQRQKIYDRKFRTGKIYTPQMVVDGDIEFVGSRESDASKAFTKAEKSAKGRITLSIEENKVKISVDGLSDSEGATLFIAIAEDGLSSSVSRGENAGKDLTHLSVVRSLLGVGKVDAGSKTLETEFVLQIEPEWNKANLKMVAFVQENQSRNIIAVGQMRVTEAVHQR